MMSDIGIALLGALVGALIGLIGGFLGARYIDRVGARRLAYTAYIGAVEVYGWDVRRRLLAIRDHFDRLGTYPPMPDSQAVNRPLGEVWTVAPDDMMDVVERVQEHLRAMSMHAAFPDQSNWRTINELLANFDNLREELVNLARDQTGEKPLPSRTFRSHDTKADLE